MDIYEEDLLFTFVMYYMDGIPLHESYHSNIDRIGNIYNDNRRLIKFFLNFFF
jgi:hypothetical protein